jgi:predicted ATPase/DNA-binding XRE family transcriptional regulator
LAEVSFGEWLKRRRGAAGLTQEQLASQINCSTSALRKFESEERRPSAEVVKQLADVFNISLEERVSFLRYARGDWQALSAIDSEDAPWRTPHVPTTPRTNLPNSMSSFIGRNKELEEIKSFIIRNRLVTLAGLGGIGKTRLSLETARKMADTFPDGIWFVELAPVLEPALVPQVMINTLGLIEQANRSPQTILVDFLRDKKSFLILDNCEHVIQACAQLAETLLQACPDLKILATSREPLGIPGELTFNVAPLSIPDIGQPFAADHLADYEAVRLFLERAQTVLPDFKLTIHNAFAISQVCQHLDGIPLALELAAARVRGLGIEQIASRLDDRFHLLTGGARTVLPRHQTLQASIDWSHDLLTESERVLLRRLSIFAGGWTLEAAEQVCADGGINSNQILDLLLHLVDKSLVVAETQATETRYQMLETIRQYAREKLWAAGEEENMRQRQLVYFVDLAERAELNLRAFDMVIWLDRMEAELDNIRMALDWAQESDIEAQLRLASALLWFWHIRGHVNEGVDWLERGLSLDALEQGDQPLRPRRAMIRGKALNATGLLRGEAHIGKAAEYFEESLLLFKALGSPGKQGMAYALMGLAGWTGIPKNDQSLSLFREVNDKFGIAQCLMSRANYARIEGDFIRAKTIGEEHLVLRKEIGDKDGISIAQAHLGAIVLRQGDYQQARELFESSLSGFREVGNVQFVCMAFSGLSAIAREQNQLEQAAEILQESLFVAQNAGLTYATPTIFDDLGRLACEQGNYDLATKMFNEELIMCRDIEDKHGTASALHGLGQIAQSTGNHFVAHSFYSKSIWLGSEISSLWIVIINLAAFAQLATTYEEFEKAGRLIGLIETRFPSLRFELFPTKRAEVDQSIVTARAALGEEAFATAYEEGKNMTLDEAIAYALEDTDASVG